MDEEGEEDTGIGQGMVTTIGQTGEALTTIATPNAAMRTTAIAETRNAALPMASRIDLGLFDTIVIARDLVRGVLAVGRVRGLGGATRSSRRIARGGIRRGARGARVRVGAEAGVGVHREISRGGRRRRGRTRRPKRLLWLWRVRKRRRSRGRHLPSSRKQEHHLPGNLNRSTSESAMDPFRLFHQLRQALPALFLPTVLAPHTPPASNPLDFLPNPSIDRLTAAPNELPLPPLSPTNLPLLLHQHLSSKLPLLLLTVWPTLLSLQQ